MPARMSNFGLPRIPQRISLKAMRTSVSLLGFLRALWLAARRDAVQNGWRVLFWHGWNMLRASARWLLKADARADADLVKSRLKHGCEGCPVFCHELNTCGDARIEADDEALGCFCYMPVKARIKDSVCWLHEPEQEEAKAIYGGWPKEFAQ